MYTTKDLLKRFSRVVFVISMFFYSSDNLCLFEVKHSKLFCLKWNIQILLKLELHTVVKCQVVSPQTLTLAVVGPC
jgi:hypothetical protein